MQQMKLNQILHFHCPRWKELPEETLLSGDLISYINNSFQFLMAKDEAITKNMIQNYVKWGMLPKPTGRKYSKDQLAILIVITVYKQVLHIQNIAKGVELQLRIMSVNEAYDSFAQALEEALQRCFSPIVGNGAYETEGMTVPHEEVGITVVSNALAMKLLGNFIIAGEGYENLGSPPNISYFQGQYTLNARTNDEGEEKQILE